MYEAALQRTARYLLEHRLGQLRVLRARVEAGRAPRQPGCASTRTNSSSNWTITGPRRSLAAARDAYQPPGSTISAALPK